MRISTKRNLLRAAAAAAVLCTAAVVFLPAAASAATFTSGASANVRSGPSTSANIVGHVSPGQTVDIGGCRNGWCYIQSPVRGFVSSSLLRNGSAVMQPNFNLSFAFPQGSFSIGTGGVSIGIGTPPKPPYGGPGPGGHGPGPGGHGPGPGGFPGGNGKGDVCFYTSAYYQGAAMCLDQGARVPYVGDAFNNKISSIRNPRGLRVEVCDDSGYDDCRTYTTNASYLGSFDNKISSIRVR